MGILSCGGSNITSVVNALVHIGVEPALISTPDRSYDFLIMPGVGAFDAGIQRLRSAGLFEVVLEHIGAGRPFVGICLGMQMLFQGSDEGTETGLSVLDGRFVKLGPGSNGGGRMPPNIGYNYVDFSSGGLDASLGEGMSAFYYFLHSYAIRTLPEGCATVGATRFNGEPFYPFFIRDNVCGIQFHPERSGRRGLALLSRVISTMGS
jgi:glutamine amidotransferase